MDITEATLILNGYQRTDWDSFVNDPAKTVTAYGGSGTIYVDYDVTNPGKTTITASLAGDTDPPTPNPATWATVPYAVSSSEISMTATTGSDESPPVEYYFEELSGNPGGADCGWQTDPNYTDTGLYPNTTYTYRVRMRDSLANTGNWSTSESATTPPAPEWTQLTYDDFEGGFGNYTDGGRDCSLYTGGKYAHQGNNAANIQDNSGDASAFWHTNGIDVHNPGYTQIKVDFWFYPRSMESGEDFWVLYFDGSQWRNVATYVSGTDFINDDFYHKEVYINESTYTFPTNMKIKFQCDASGNYDDIYIDEIDVSAK